MTELELKDRAKRFAHRCVKLALSLSENTLGKHISGQLIRCSTSVAANYRATCLAQSQASFVSKMSIVIEECDESEYWLEFIIDAELLPKERISDLMKEANELSRIFISSRKTVSDKLNKNQSKIINQKSKMDN